MTSMILGGIKIPNVPDPQTTPTASGLLYPCFNMVGTDNSPSNTTDAPIIPVAAASMIPIRATVTASPPRTFPNKSCMENIIFSAIPDLSSIRPIKMNMGTATRTQLSMSLYIRLTTIPTNMKSIPVHVSRYMSDRYPISVNKAATPANTKGMGYPVKSSPMNVKNIIITRILCISIKRVPKTCV